jgi:hypothetical protein
MCFGASAPSFIKNEYGEANEKNNIFNFNT